MRLFKRYVPKHRDTAEMHEARERCVQELRRAELIKTGQRSDWKLV